MLVFDEKDLARQVASIYSRRLRVCEILLRISVAMFSNKMTTIYEFLLPTTWRITQRGLSRSRTSK